MCSEDLASHILVSFQFFQLIYEIMVNLLILQSVLQCPFEPFKLGQLSPICFIISATDKLLNFINFSPKAKLYMYLWDLKSYITFSSFVLPPASSWSFPGTNNNYFKKYRRGTLYLCSNSISFFHEFINLSYLSFPSDAVGKESPCQCRRHRRHGFGPWVRKIPWSRKWQPSSGFWPGKFHALRSLAGYSPRIHKSQTGLSMHTLRHTPHIFHIFNP